MERLRGPPSRPSRPLTTKKHYFIKKQPFLPMAQDTINQEAPRKRYDFDRVARLVITLVTVVAIIYVLNYLSSVLLPFLIGSLLASTSTLAISTPMSPGKISRRPPSRSEKTRLELLQEFCVIFKS